MVGSPRVLYALEGDVPRPDAGNATIRIEPWHYGPMTSDDNPALSPDHSDSNRATYDRIAQRYAETQEKSRTESDDLFFELESSFIAKLPAKAVVVDMGCGPGMDSARFAARGYRVVGLDLSAGMLAVAARSLPGRVVQGDMRALPIGSHRLDGIWSVASLLHVPERDTPKVLSEFRRTLRSSGLLALVTALGEGESFEEVPYAPNEERWFAYRHPETLLGQVVDAGFRIDAQSQVTGNRLWITVLASPI
jgi:SAM-dependent methyltransferase